VHPSPVESHVNNVNPEPPVIKPNTLKYVTPSHVLKDLGTSNGHNSPKLERGGSIG